MVTYSRYRQLSWFSAWQSPTESGTGSYILLPSNALVIIFLQISLARLISSVIWKRLISSQPARLCLHGMVWCEGYKPHTSIVGWRTLITGNAHMVKMRALVDVEFTWFRCLQTFCCPSGCRHGICKQGCGVLYNPVRCRGSIVRIVLPLWSTIFVKEHRFCIHTLICNSGKGACSSRLLAPFVRPQKCKLRSIIIWSVSVLIPKSVTRIVHLLSGNSLHKCL